jgi:hypothetical protein
MFTLGAAARHAHQTVTGHDFAPAMLASFLTWISSSRFSAFCCYGCVIVWAC